ncbi:MAG: ferritin [Candidatus Eisenbacteria bacterium]
MLKKTMEKALNKQMNAEFWSANLYLSMAAFFQSKNLGGFAHWMRLQLVEENMHAMKFFDFILDRGGMPKLEAFAAPPDTWKTALAVFESVLEHERSVSAGIHNLVDLARKNSDFPSDTFLQWFVTEQVEEEAAADDIVQKLKLVGNQGHGIFMIDRELSQRPAPAAAAGGA